MLANIVNEGGDKKAEEGLHRQSNTSADFTLESQSESKQFGWPRENRQVQKIKKVGNVLVMDIYVCVCVRCNSEGTRGQSQEVQKIWMYYFRGDRERKERDQHVNNDLGNKSSDSDAPGRDG